MRFISRSCAWRHVYVTVNVFKFVHMTTAASVTSATPCGPTDFPEELLIRVSPLVERAMKFSVAGVCASLCAALAMVPRVPGLVRTRLGPVDAFYRFVTNRPAGTLDRVCKLDMEQHCKWIVHGAASLRGKG